MTDLRQLSPSELARLDEIASAMSLAGLPPEFIASMSEAARAGWPVFDMMQLWMNGTDGEDRNETVAHLHEMLGELQHDEAAVVEVELALDEFRARVDTLCRECLGVPLERAYEMLDAGELHGTLIQIELDMLRRWSEENR